MNQANVDIFSDYIFPSFKDLVHDEEPLVRAAYAECIARLGAYDHSLFSDLLYSLADTAIRFLDSSESFIFENPDSDLQPSERVSSQYRLRLTPSNLYSSTMTNLCICFSRLSKIKSYRFYSIKISLSKRLYLRIYRLFAFSLGRTRQTILFSVT